MCTLFKLTNWHKCQHGAAFQCICWLVLHCNVIECIVIECCIWWRCAVFIRKSWPGGPRPRHLLAPSHHFPCCHHHGDDDEDVDQYHDCQRQDSHKKEEHGDRGLKRGEWDRRRGPGVITRDSFPVVTVTSIRLLSWGGRKCSVWDPHRSTWQQVFWQEMVGRTEIKDALDGSLRSAECATRRQSKDEEGDFKWKHRIGMQKREGREATINIK